jgi:hypothetical protein
MVDIRHAIVIDALVNRVHYAGLHRGRLFGMERQTNYFTSCNTTGGRLIFRLKAPAEGLAPGPLLDH